MAVNPKAKHRIEREPSLFELARKDRERRAQQLGRKSNERPAMPAHVAKACQEAEDQASKELAAAPMVTLRQPGNPMDEKTFKHRLAAFRRLVKKSNGAISEVKSNHEGVFIFAKTKVKSVEPVKPIKTGIDPNDIQFQPLAVQQEYQRYVANCERGYSLPPNYDQLDPIAQGAILALAKPSKPLPFGAWKRQVYKPAA